MLSFVFYTLSLHDALPIFAAGHPADDHSDGYRGHAHHVAVRTDHRARQDRKSTRLNSSHVAISYAVFCLKTKMNNYLRTLCNSNGDTCVVFTDAEPHTTVD